MAMSAEGGWPDGLGPEGLGPDGLGPEGLWVLLLAVGVGVWVSVMGGGL